jgi:hypothetical protein
MAILGIIEKQPREVLDFNISYVTTLANRSDTLASVSTEVSPTTTPVVVNSTTVDAANKLVKVVISAGTDAVSYKVTVMTTTTGALVFEDEVTVVVEEA